MLSRFRVRRVFRALYNNTMRTRRARLTRKFLAAPSNYQINITKHCISHSNRAILRRIRKLGLHVTETIPMRLPSRLLIRLGGRFVKVLLINRPSDNGAALLHRVTQRLTKVRQQTYIISRHYRVFPPNSSRGVPPLSLLSNVPGRQTIRVTLHALSPRVVLLSRLNALTRATTLRRNLCDKISFITDIRTTDIRRTTQQPRIRTLRQRKVLHMFMLLRNYATPKGIQRIYAM